MHHKAPTSAVLFALLLSLALAHPSCRPQQAPGSASFVASLGQSLSAVDVTRVQVTVSANDLTPSSIDLVKTNGQWRGLIGSIPAGSNRTFAAKAFSSTNTLLFEGQATGVTITAGQTTVVSITLQPRDDGPLPGNEAPIIDSLIASASTVQPGGTITLQATAHDPNPGDLITYSWTATAGTFGAPVGTSINWTAPQAPGPVTLRLTVTDQVGAATSMDLTITVQVGTGNADVIIRLNTWPHVSSISVSPSPVAVGEMALLRATAGDVEGDPLSYQWSASGCTGSWQGATTSEAQFKPDALRAGGACSCQLKVTVSDGNGGQASRSLALCVQTSTQTPKPPVVKGTFQSAHTVPGGTSVTLRVLAEDPQGGALTYAWMANEGTLGTPTNSGSQSEIVWTAPPCVPLGTTPTIQVTLKNAQGLTTTFTFTVNGVLGCGPLGPRSSPWTFLGGLAAPRMKHSAVLLPSGKVFLVGGNSAELYDPASNTSASTSFSTEASRGEGTTLTLLPDGKVLVVGGGVSIAEVYDPSTDTWSSAGPISHSIYGQTATLLPSGKVLIAGGGSNGGFITKAELYDLSTGTWAPTGSMATPRAWHSATLLPSGKVLVTGGVNKDGVTSLATAELYDPATGTWSSTSSLTTPRASHTSTLLTSGKVLVIAGTYNRTPVATAELYDPVTETWSAAGSMITPRAWHTATLLSSQKVLVVGGLNSHAGLNTAEIYNPATGTWSSAESMRVARAYHTATLLPSGKALVAGGEGQSSNINAAAGMVETYDPTTNHWESTSFISLHSIFKPVSSTLLSSGEVFVPLGYNSSGYAAATFNPLTKLWTPISGPDIDYDATVTQLASGKLFLVSGRLVGTFDPSTSTWSSASMSLYQPVIMPLLSGKLLLMEGNRSTTRLYDPLTDTWSTTGSLNTSRYNVNATRLHSGQVLVTGGYNDAGLIVSAELYDPITGVWTATTSMPTPHSGHLAFLLPSGKVLIAGGNQPNTVELYDPATASWSSLPPLPTSFEPKTATLLTSGKVLVVSSSQAQIFDPLTNTWTPAGTIEATNYHSTHLLGSGEVLLLRGDYIHWLVPAIYTP